MIIYIQIKKVRYLKMFKKSKKFAPQYAEYRVTWRWLDDEKIEVTEGNSAGIASLLADWGVEVISIERIYP